MLFPTVFRFCVRHALSFNWCFLLCFGKGNIHVSLKNLQCRCPPPPIFFPSFSFSSCFSCLLSFFFFFSFMPNWACYRTRLSYLFTFSPFPFFSSPLTYAWLPSNFFSSPFLFLLGPCQASLFSLLSSSFLALIRLLSSLSYFLLVGLGWA